MMPSSMDRADEATDKAQAPESVVEALLRVASAARYFRSPDGRLHAQVPLKNRHEIFELRTRAFRDWLLASFRSERALVPSDCTVRRALWAIEAQARFDESTAGIHVRVGRES